jgi:phosphoribosylanthranilate isomerase
MWTKICGITNFQDAQAAADAGASAIGLNFFEGSRRFVRSSDASRVREALTSDIDIVGVFVNASVDEISKIANQTRLSAVQFHGDESDDLLLQFRKLQPNIAIIRAVRLDNSNLNTVQSRIRSLSRVVPNATVLVDAHVSGEFGGTGQQVDPDAVRKLLQDTGLTRIILAGGLKPDNVADVVQELQPWGVDTASGVESEPGIKNHDLIRQFVHNAAGKMPGNKDRL